MGHTVQDDYMMFEVKGNCIYIQVSPCRLFGHCHLLAFTHVHTDAMGTLSRRLMLTETY